MDGRDHGYRVPTAYERARETGRERYLAALGLSEKALYDLCGNHFAVEAVIAVAGSQIWDWLEYGAVHSVQYPNVYQVLQIYENIKAHVEQQHVPAVQTPVPHEVIHYIGACIGQLGTGASLEGGTSATEMAQPRPAGSACMGNSGGQVTWPDTPGTALAARMETTPPNHGVAAANGAPDMHTDAAWPAHATAMPQL